MKRIFAKSGQIGAVIIVWAISGLVATGQCVMMHLPFNGNTEDESGLNHDGVAYNAVLTGDRFGNPNSAYYFNSSNARIEVSDDPDLRPANFTTSFWFYYAYVPGDIRSLAGKPLCGGWANSWSVWIMYGALHYGWANGPASMEYYSVAAPAAGMWHHLALTFDDANNQAKLYMDGVLTATHSSSMTIAYDNMPVIYGAEYENCGLAFYLDGLIDDAVIYNQVLDAAQIGALYYENTVNITYYEDLDGDGFGNPLTGIPSCNPIPGYVANDGDCDDNNSAIPYTTQQYRTAQSGNWTSASTWQKFDGCNWNPATSYPTSADASILIRNGHTVTVNSNLTLNEVTVESGGTLNQTAGSIALSGAQSILFQNGSVFNWNTIVDGSGSIQTDPGSTTNINNASLLNTDFNNYGTINWLGGNWYVTSAPGTAVNNYGTLNISSDGEIGPVYFGSSCYFVNHAGGVMNKTGSPSDETQFAAFNNSTGNFVTNQGTINIHSGKLNFVKEFNNSGTIYVGAGSTLRLSGTEFNANFGAGTIFTGTGNINVEKNINGFSTTGFWIQEDVAITTNTFNLISGLVSGTTGKQLIFEGTSTVNWTGGIFSLGIHVINNSANFNMMSSSHGLCQNFTNNGTLNWSGGDIVNGYFAAGTGSPVVSIVNNGTWNINTDADVSSGPAGNGNTITFDNGLNGVINKNGTAGQYTELGGAFFTFNNAGTIHILTGNLSFGGTLNQYNTVSISSVSKFRYQGGGADVSSIFRLYSTSQFPGSGDIEIVGGYPIVVPISPVNLSGHNVLFDTNNGKIYGGAMTIENGTFIWASGGLNGVIFSIDASATLISTSVTSNPSPGRIMSENTTVINDGTWNWIDGDIIGTSPFSIGSDQNNVENNGTWNISCTAGDYLVVNYTTSTVTNNGTIYGQTEFTTAGATPAANLTFINNGDIFEGPCGFISLPNSITSFGAFGQFCAGASFDVTFTTDLVFSGGNIFTVQLSSSTGSFSSPVAIGALASSGSSGVINATIPPGTTPGTGYRLRVVSSNPGYIGIDNGSDIVIGLMVTHYADSDGDGYGDPDSPQEIDTCFPVPAGYVLNADDCDDNDPSVNPFGSEICNGIDDNCDGTTDEGFDADDDGHTTCEGDCDDTYGNIYPGAPELCDGIDQDCDGSIDEDFDIDLDNYTTCEGDCDDNDASVNPGMTEICNGIDDNCNGSIDEGFDLDGDGYTICNGDCDDVISDVNPGADEVCNGIDDNCDGSVDEGFDIDNDGYTTCQNDCNDNDPSIFPGAVEILCNGIDDNCNGTIDEGRVNGCMNPAACNYDPSATCDDGSCLVDYGCTNAAACNYDPAATCDDGSCLVDYGCMNPAACNYDPAATCDDGSCLVDYGCTNPVACNYDTAATCDDGSCLVEYGCMNPAACNYDPAATCDDGSCLVDYGCTNAAACNYDPAATCDDGSCLVEYGCMNPAACNFDPAATCDDGSCLVDYGCTNAAACNYDPAATCDDGSCLVDYGCTNATACNYDPAATCDDGSCLVDYGCTNPLAVNFDPSATCEDGSCHFNGCTYANANNYNALALVDDGTCIWLGCTNPLAINYNAMATVDDGNCVIPVYGCTYAGAENFNPIATHDDGSCLCPEVCPGDLDGNGVINISDLLGFMGVFGTSCN